MMFLNNKQKKEFEKEIEDSWGAKIDFEAVMMTGSSKYWLLTKEVGNVNKDKMRIESMGNYFARRDKNNQIRLSIEGSQVIGPISKKNVAEISDKDLHLWLRGQNIDIKTGFNGYVILKHGKDYVGCGKAYEKGVLNHVPKERRIKNL